MAGYFSIPRVERDLFGDEREVAFCRRGAWHWLFEQAAWKDCERSVGRFKIRLRKGELAASLRFLARAWGWTHGKVQRFLDLLRKRGLVNLRTDPAGLLVISLCKAGITDRPGDSPTESAKPSNAAAETSGRESPVESKENQINLSRDSRGGGLVRRFASPSATATPEGRKAARVQLVYRWIGARFSGAAAMAARLGLMSDDPGEAQRWLDRLDTQLRAEQWAG